MPYLSLRHARTGTFLIAAVATLVACGGSDGELPLPQLAAAVGATFNGSCASLQSTFAGLANTQITASETIADGVLTVAGKPVGEHCRIAGKMHERTRAVDGNTYAISFEIRLPKNWNGRFLHQGNGGTDGAVLTATTLPDAPTAAAMPW